VTSSALAPGSGDPFGTTERVTLFGVPVVNATRPEAIAVLLDWVRESAAHTRSVYLVNAHTLNLACDDSAFRDVLADADVVFGDGSGVRLAARLHGRAMRDNMVGTDLVPELFAAAPPSGLRCYLLGGTSETASRAASWVEQRFPKVRVVGHRDGYVWAEDRQRVVAHINESGADLLLVGMGNPLQEQWIARERAHLRVAVSIGVGGLFDHWAGTLKRAAPWVRALGIEWVQILLQQPAKWRRYVLGNPRFVARAWLDARRR
jgi:N-acetylglucosaminyldiphosphoundecaprenol N-acetyl-beta-D-mannosaminyltransferase